MNSILTFEERVLLQSLGCRSRQDALKVLSDMVGRVPVNSRLFSTVAGLIIKLKEAGFDFAYEMRAENVFADDTTEML